MLDSRFKTFLLQIAYSSDANFTTMHKLRALKCILSVVSSDHQSLQCLSELKSDENFDLEQHLQASLNPWNISVIGDCYFGNHHFLAFIFHFIGRSVSRSVLIIAFYLRVPWLFFYKLKAESRPLKITNQLVD